MSIPATHYGQIAAIDVDVHKTRIAYSYWESTFPPGTFLRTHVDPIRQALGSEWTRSEIVSFYQQQDVLPETKFIAAMIWGNEAPAGSRRDSRGPWRLSQMFADPAAAVAAIRSVSVTSEAEIAQSYQCLDKALDRCGPNFFTKHFYFTGKASGAAEYPLIFDDRVATGLVRVNLADPAVLGAVRVSAERTPEAYLSYLKVARDTVANCGCQMDQVEYYLFTR